MTSMREVMIEMGFSSAHALRGYRGKCENTHGHNYRVEVYVRGNELKELGLLIDFELNPSAEHLAGYFLHEVGREINSDRVQVFKVRVWETDTCSATYSID